jgi:protein-tyrosine phosphatase
MPSVTHIPFDELPGKIYRSPMPFGPYDESHQVYPEIHRLGIVTIVMLTSDEEAMQKSGLNLREFYISKGLEVLYLPIADFDTPQREILSQTITNTIQQARRGEHILVHCSAGCGRTGLFLAELAKAIKGYSGEEAIEYIRKWLPCAIESEGQKAFVLDP